MNAHPAEPATGSPPAADSAGSAASPPAADSPSTAASPPAADSPSAADSLPGARARIERGGAPRYHEAAAAKGARGSPTRWRCSPAAAAGRIFHTQVRASGSIPQVCALFGPSAAGGAYIPAFCDFVSAVSDATVPKICVVVRKAYGAGLYAMAGPGFEPDATLALPTAKIAVMGAEAAVNAVYAGKLAEITDPDERAAETARLRQAYDRDIDVMRLAGDLVIDDIVEPEDLRAELIRRFAAARGKDRAAPRRRHGIAPV